MEKHLNKKVDKHQIDFKNAIKEWLADNNAEIMDKNNIIKTGGFLQFIYDYNNLSLTNEDFKKRKRIKNVVPQYDLCIAKRANGEQCTRRKKIPDDETTTSTNYCGTHIKGTPHGIVNSDIEMAKSVKKVEVWVKDIKGINYYIDAQHNVYKPEDIMANKPNPSVIASWVKVTDDIYSIPQFGI